MTDLEREQRAEATREKRHGTKKFVMGALLAVLVAGGAYILISSGSGKQDVAQSEVTAPEFAPSAVPMPSALPPVPLPEATPMPKTSAPTPLPADTPSPTP